MKRARAGGPCAHSCAEFSAVDFGNLVHRHARAIDARPSTSYACCACGQLVQKWRLGESVADRRNDILSGCACGCTLLLDVARSELYCCACRDYVYLPAFDEGRQLAHVVHRYVDRALHPGLPPHDPGHQVRTKRARASCDPALAAWREQIVGPSQGQPSQGGQPGQSQQGRQRPRRGGLTTRVLAGSAALPLEGGDVGTGGGGGGSGGLGDDSGEEAVVVVPAVENRDTGGGGGSGSSPTHRSVGYGEAVGGGCGGVTAAAAGTVGGGFLDSASDGFPPGLRGLNNLGNTCFMSSVLQVFIHSPQLRNYFLGQGHPQASCSRHGGGSGGSSCLSCELDAVFAAAYSGDRAPLSPTDFLYSWWTFADSLAGYQQQDAHEFYLSALSGLASAVISSTPPPPPSPPRPSSPSQPPSGGVGAGGPQVKQEGGLAAGGGWCTAGGGSGSGEVKMEEYGGTAATTYGGFSGPPDLAVRSGVKHQYLGASSPPRQTSPGRRTAAATASDIATGARQSASAQSPSPPPTTTHNRLTTTGTSAPPSNNQPPSNSTRLSSHPPPSAPPPPPPPALSPVAVPLRPSSPGPISPGTANLCLVDVVFGGVLRSDVTCDVCGHTSTAYDPFLDISLDMVAFGLPPQHPPAPTTSAPHGPATATGTSPRPLGDLAAALSPHALGSRTPMLHPNSQQHLQPPGHDPLGMEGGCSQEGGDMARARAACAVSDRPSASACGGGGDGGGWRRHSHSASLPSLSLSPSGSALGTGGTGMGPGEGGMEESGREGEGEGEAEEELQQGRFRTARGAVPSASGSPDVSSVSTGSGSDGDGGGGGAEAEGEEDEAIMIISSSESEDQGGRTERRAASRPRPHGGGAAFTRSPGGTASPPLPPHHSRPGRPSADTDGADGANATDALMIDLTGEDAPEPEVEVEVEASLTPAPADAAGDGGRGVRACHVCSRPAVGGTSGKGGSREVELTGAPAAAVGKGPGLELGLKGDRREQQGAAAGGDGGANSDSMAAAESAAEGGGGGGSGARGAGEEDEEVSVGVAPVEVEGPVGAGPRMGATVSGGGGGGGEDEGGDGVSLVVAAEGDEAAANEAGTPAPGAAEHPAGAEGMTLLLEGKEEPHVEAGVVAAGAAGGEDGGVTAALPLFRGGPGGRRGGRGMGRGGRGRGGRRSGLGARGLAGRGRGGGGGAVPQMGQHGADPADMVDAKLTRRPTAAGGTASDPYGIAAAGYASLQACLRAFVTPERLSPSEAWTCGACCRRQPAVKQLSIRRLPPVLALHVKRFEQRHHHHHHTHHTHQPHLHPQPEPNPQPNHQQTQHPNPHPHHPHQQQQQGPAVQDPMLVQMDRPNPPLPSEGSGNQEATAAESTEKPGQQQHPVLPHQQQQDSPPEQQQQQQLEGQQGEATGAVQSSKPQEQQPQPPPAGQEPGPGQAAGAGGGVRAGGGGRGSGRGRGRGGGSGGGPGRGRGPGGGAAGRHNRHAARKIQTQLHFPLTLDLTPYTTPAILRERYGIRPGGPGSASATTAATSTPSPNDNAPCVVKTECTATGAATCLSDGECTAPTGVSHPSCQYRLFAVISHKGDLTGGHYVVFVRPGGGVRGGGDTAASGDGDGGGGDGGWYQCDDAWVTSVSEASVMACQAYMLFYCVGESG